MSSNEAIAAGAATGASAAPTKVMARRTAKATNSYAPYEDKLNARGAKWRYVASVPLVDITRYPDAQARQRLSGSKTVNEYATKMQQGEVFPPLVIGEDGTVGYMMLDGNTRKAADEKLGRTHTDAYIVEIHDSNEALYLSALFNTIGPVPLTDDEILRAIRAGLAMNPPMSGKTLAQDLGRTPLYISRIAQADAYDQRAERLGMAKDIPAQAKRILVQIPDDSVLQDAVALTLDAELKSTDLTALVKEIGKQGSEADRRRVVADDRIDRQTVIQHIASGRTTTAPPAKDSLMAFGRIHTLMGKFPDVDDWVPVRQETRDAWIGKIQEIEVFLADLSIAYQAAGITP